jgi:hypothetical protein
VAGASLLAPGAADAANLIANPGFESAGTSGTVFSDTLPDLAAWQVTSGSFVLAGGSLTSNGLGTSTDLAVVANSQDYQDGSLSATVVPITISPQEVGGLVVRYQDTANFFLCALTKNAVVVQRRLAGADTVIATAAYTPAAGSSYTVTATATGSTISCRAVGPGGVSATATATDTHLPAGMIGLAAINSNSSQQRQARFTQPVTMTAAVPQSWNGPGVLAGRPGLIADHVAPANSGSGYLQLFGGAGTFSGDAQQASIAVSGGTSYTLSAAIRTDAVSGAAKVLAIEPDGTTTTLASVSGTTAWTVYSTTVTTQPTTSSLTVRLQLNGSGRASFDDLSLSVTPAVSLSVSTSSVDFGAVDPLSSPFTLANTSRATVTSNTTWALSLQGAGDFSDTTGKTFPLSRLGWRVNGSGSFTAVTTTAQSVASGSSNAPSGTTTPLDFQLQVTYADPVSSQPFTTTITYIATTP